MTIPAAPSSTSYAGDGTSTVFSVPFVFFGASEIEVIERDATTGIDTIRTLGAHYTVTGGAGGPGSITATAAPAVGRTWTIRRNSRREQLVDYQADGAADLETLELLADRLTAITQEIDRRVERTLRAPDADQPMPALPPAAVRAGKVAAWDSSGNPTTMTVSAGTVINYAQWGGTAGGTANARTVTPSPALPAYGAGVAVEFVNGSAANTGPATLNVSGLGAQSILRPDGSALQAGDLPSGAVISVRHDGAAFRLLTVQTAVAMASESASGIVELATQAETNAGTDAVRAITPATMRNLRRATSLQTSGYTVVATDNDRLIRCDGAFVLALTAAATLGDGFRCRVRNVGTGVITIDPAGAETINGAATLAVPAGQAFYLDCDGAAWHAIGSARAEPYRSPEQTITLNGTVTLAHGLGAKPDVLHGKMVCKIVELGYSVGDEVDVPLCFIDYSSGFGIGARSDATNVIIRYSLNMGLQNLATGSTTNITPANWRLVVIAARL